MQTNQICAVQESCSKKGNRSQRVPSESLQRILGLCFPTLVAQELQHRARRALRAAPCLDCSSSFYWKRAAALVYLCLSPCSFITGRFAIHYNTQPQNFLLKDSCLILFAVIWQQFARWRSHSPSSGGGCWAILTTVMDSLKFAFTSAAGGEQSFQGK